MKELFRTLPLMCVVLLVPVLPFLAFGDQFEAWAGDLARNPPSDQATMLIVIGLLATDILLPVPSSVVSTMSGWQLGWLQGTFATWIGMNLGAIVGFVLARRLGPRFARVFSTQANIERMHELNHRFGPVVLVLTRALPVFAEAGVLMAGIHGLSWSRFLPAIVLSNLGVAVAYSMFGDYAEQHQWLPLALGVAIAVPVLIAAVAHRVLPSLPSASEHPSDADGQPAD